MNPSDPLPYEEALSRILSAISPRAVCQVPCGDAAGRVAAEDVPALLDLPPFANSSMDGYACIAADTAAATPNHPVCLRIVGESAAGHAQSAVVASGQAMAISTGAAMPPGADAVVMVEETRPCADPAFVEILSPITPGQYVRSAGEDVQKGAIVIDAGTLLRPGAIALIAASGHARVRVHGTPRVALIATGSELAMPGEKLATAQIYDSNSLMLASLVREAGAVCGPQIRSTDDIQSLRSVIEGTTLQKADMIVTTGGVSVGQHDYVKQLVSETGEIDFWRVAIRPGKPFAFGRIAGRPIFGLPGNPASAFVTFELFVRPALRRMAGHADCVRPTIGATLTETVEHEPGRKSYVRAHSEWVDGRLHTRSAGLQASHRFRSLAAANSLLIIPEDRSRIVSGETVSVLLLGPE
ncbi:MAG: molybdopterin molybdotransferase MoeA [Capsulimonadaceae bacterium]|nr:molybdopterin molybdotransferase MoeA [Capsulimonadaceae bacterium]